MIKLPFQYTPRDYQRPVWKAFFEDGIRHLILLWHRRAGKDKTGLNLTIAAALQTVGEIYYLFPQLKQARRVIWEGRGKDNVRFIDHFPPELIHNINNADMKVELVNGSLFRLCGADFYDVLRGSNPMGIVYSEYAHQNPMARETLLPILAENHGFEMFFYTPFGQNHGYELYATNLDNPEWYCKKLTIDDTRHPDGTPVISHERVAEMVRGGMSQDMADQEFMCSFTAAIKGAYFTKQLRLAEHENRIVDFPLDQTLCFDTYWDIGIGDSTAIWFVQYTGLKYYCINYYENTGEGLPHYIQIIDDFKRDNCLLHRTAYFPHDGVNREWGTGDERSVSARNLGLDVSIVQRIKEKMLAIDKARLFFNKVTFHKTNCFHGLRALRECRATFNEKRATNSTGPEKNWALHGADAFMGIAQAEGAFNRSGYQVYKNRVGL